MTLTIDRTLKELTRLTFSREYNYLEGPHKIRGKSGKKWIFDALIKNTNSDKYGVFVRDWKREISITQLRQLHKACLDTNMSGGILVCNYISEFSRDYSKQFGIQLLSRGEMISILRNRQIEI
ncbi:MAG: restriction endonuclease [Promethearchaeota archaeon]